MLLKSFFLILITSLLTKIVYSQSYVACDINIPNSCLIGLYYLTNSHAILCNQSKPISYGCEIRNEFYTVPISFSSANCQGQSSLFLYNISNSHVGYARIYDSNTYSGTIPVCLDSYFKDIMEISDIVDLENTFFLIGLYNITNSHVTTDRNARRPIYLRISDRIYPEINLNNTNTYISLPITVLVNFSDNKYLYYCQVYVNNKLYDYSAFCRLRNYFESTLTITSNECPSDQCSIRLIAGDLAGNVKMFEYTYIVINPCLQIEVPSLTWDSLVIVDFVPYDLRVKISNPRTCYGSFINITISFPGSECNNLILVDGLQKRTINITRLSNGESYEFKTRIFPLRSGRCNFVINIEGYSEELNIKQNYKKEIPLSISVRTSAGLLVVSEPLYSLIIAILLISLILFL